MWILVFMGVVCDKVTGKLGRRASQFSCHKGILFSFFDMHCVYTGYTKKMVLVQKLTRNWFLTLHGQNVHRQQRQLSKFLMHYQQFARSCLLRGCEASVQDGVAAGKGFLCAPFWGVQICDYSAACAACSAVHGLDKTHHSFVNTLYKPTSLLSQAKGRARIVVYKVTGLTLSVSSFILLTKVPCSWGPSSL